MGNFGTHANVLGRHRGEWRLFNFTNPWCFMGRQVVVLEIDIDYKGIGGWGSPPQKVLDLV